jgi:hypothetical protein
MSKTYAIISSDKEAVSLKQGFSKHSGEMLDTSTEEPLSDTDTYIQDTTPKAYDEDNINNYYVGDIVIEKYYNICRNLKVSVYKNLPPNIWYNSKTQTEIYNCFYYDNKNNYYFIKAQQFIIDGQPFKKVLKSKYKDMLVC